MAPQTARISAAVTGVEPQGKAYICTLAVRRVHGYGAATPPLPVGKQLRVVVRDAQVQRAGDSGRRLLRQGSVVEVTIRYQPPMEIQPPPPSWRLAEIH